MPIKKVDCEVNVFEGDDTRQKKNVTYSCGPKNRPYSAPHQKQTQNEETNNQGDDGAAATFIVRFFNTPARLLDSITSSILLRRVEQMS